MHARRWPRRVGDGGTELSCAGHAPQPAAAHVAAAAVAHSPAAPSCHQEQGHRPYPQQGVGRGGKQTVPLWAFYNPTAPGTQGQDKGKKCPQSNPHFVFSKDRQYLP